MGLGKKECSFSVDVFTVFIQDLSRPSDMQIKTEYGQAVQQGLRSEACGQAALEAKYMHQLCDSGM